MAAWYINNILDVLWLLGMDFCANKRADGNVIIQYDALECDLGLIPSI